MPEPFSKPKIFIWKESRQVFWKIRKFVTLLKVTLLLGVFTSFELYEWYRSDLLNVRSEFWRWSVTTDFLKNHKFFDDFSGNKSQLIHFNLLNIKNEIWQGTLVFKWSPNSNKLFSFSGFTFYDITVIIHKILWQTDILMTQKMAF